MVFNILQISYKIIYIQYDVFIRTKQVQQPTYECFTREDEVARTNDSLLQPN